MLTTQSSFELRSRQVCIWNQESFCNVHATWGLVQGGCPAVDATCTSIHATDPLRGALVDNGGLTPTIVPGLAGSAIDQGGDSAGAAVPVSNLDQRGMARPCLAHCDIGAVQFDDAFSNDLEHIVSRAHQTI